MFAAGVIPKEMTHVFPDVDGCFTCCILCTCLMEDETVVFVIL